MLWMYVLHVTSLAASSMTLRGRRSRTQPFLNGSHVRLIYRLKRGCLVARGLKDAAATERERDCCRGLSLSGGPLLAALPQAPGCT